MQMLICSYRGCLVLIAVKIKYVSTILSVPINNIEQLLGTNGIC